MPKRKPKYSVTVRLPAGIILTFFGLFYFAITGAYFTTTSKVTANNIEDAYFYGALGVIFFTLGTVCLFLEIKKRILVKELFNAGLSALMESEDSGKKYKMFAAFDHEEVGSTSAQGARSGFLSYTLERISKNLRLMDDACFQAIANSTSISADTAHAIHPNYSDKHDPENRPVLGGGPVIKYSASQRYSTNAFSAAYFMEACGRAKVPYQKYVNRNDIVGGSTIGPALSSLTTIPTVDISTPMLAMHSIRELGAVADNFYAKEAFCAYYEDEERYF